MQKNHSYIIADHMRSAIFITADGVEPASKGAGYVLRRLIRRAFSSALALGIDISNRNFFEEVSKTTQSIYDGYYPEIESNHERFVEILVLEASKYLKAVERGEKEWQKIFTKNSEISDEEIANITWDLYQTNGVPFEVSETEVGKKNRFVDLSKLESLVQDHQAKSKEAGQVQFKSGLAGDSVKTRALHTTTHILHRVLRDTFGEDLHQIGSAITDQKARFDVNLNENLSPEQIIDIEQKVNSVIESSVPMIKIETNPEEAKNLGAIGLFGEKYGDVVSVYTLEKDGKIYSREFCGGPHVGNTNEIGNFKILKVKSIGAGKKRFEFDVN